MKSAEFRRITLLRVAMALAAMTVSATPPRAQSATEFYAGRQINVIVSHPAGGGVDIYARFFGRHLKRLLAGHPDVVIRNMPGAGGVAMANYMAGQAAKDGSVIGVGVGWLATAALSGPTGARYDARQFSWIGNMNAEVAVVVAWNNHPVKTAADLHTTELAVAAGGLSALTATTPLSLNALLGMKFKVVTGYTGTADQMLALERGEVGGMAGYNYASLKSSRPDWLRDRKVNVLMQYTFEPHPELGNVPSLTKLVRTPDERAVFELLVLPQEMGRPVFGPPGIPQDRLQALRAAFDLFVGDAAVLADAEKTQLEIYKPMSGGEVAAMVNRLHEASPDLYRKAAEAMLPPGLAKQGETKP